MSNLKDLLLKLGFKEDQLNEDMDVNSVFDSYQETQKDVFITKYGGEIKEEAEKSAKKAIKRKMAVELNRKFNLGSSRRDAESQDPFTMLETIEIGGDGADKDALIQEMNGYKDQIVTLKAAHATELEVIDNTRKEMAVNSIIEKSINRISFANKDRESIDRNFLRQEILNNYTINHETGKLLDKSGSKALNFEGTGTFETVDEPIDVLVNKYKLSAKRAAVEDETGAGGDDTPNTNKGFTKGSIAEQRFNETKHLVETNNPFA